MSFPSGFPTGILTPRAVVKHGNYAVIPKDGLCKNVIPCLEACDVSVLASPRLGAGFAFYRAQALPGKGTSAPWAAEEGIESYVYVYEGHARLRCMGQAFDAPAASFLYAPPGAGMEFENVGEGEMTLLLYRQRYKPLKGVAAPAAPIFGSAWDLPVENLFGMENVQRVLTLPDELSMDLAVNLMSFQPGGCHTYAETHADEHAMYVLEGEGAYWLGDNWSITKKDDFVWMGPFCPQAAYGVGRHRYTYLLTKDVNRDVEL